MTCCFLGLLFGLLRGPLRLPATGFQERLTRRAPPIQFYK
jgi:hypothetical protein